MFRGRNPRSTRTHKVVRIGLRVSLTLALLVVPFAALTAIAPSAGAVTIPSSQGTDFYVSFESNCTFNGCGTPSGPGNLYVFISGSTATSGTVSDTAISFSQTFSVTPGVATSISIPSSAEIDTNDTAVVGGALHITAGAPVSAYGLNTLSQTTDGFLGLPTPILGTSYLVEAYEGGAGSQFAVVGTQNGTTATITPSDTTGAYTAGVSYTVSLNQGDVYQLVDTSGGDLSGTTITSNNPVAVFAGNDCADVPTSDTACNTLAEEMTPTDTWGTDFLTEPFATRSGDTFRVMASTNATAVDIDGSSVATLNAGQFYETILSAASTITANNPIQVMQYSNGESYDGVSADPFDVTIPPTEQFLNSYTVSAEPSGADPNITQNYLNVVAPTSEVASITLDGSLLPAADFTPIAGSSYSGAQVAVGFGSHTISASLPFGLTVYGYGGYDGYGYPGGFTLSPVATVTNVSLAPTTSSYTIGSSACETATVTDQNSNPVSGVRVDFTVTGANPNAGFAYTATDGTAQYCYTGNARPTDTETAAVGAVTSNTATINWGVAQTSLTTSLSGGGQSGATISVPTSTDVTDAATLTGTNAATATGTITYDVYSDSGCTDVVSTGTPQTITTPGMLPASNPVSLPNVGTYYWQASYSGDSVSNAPSTSTCGNSGEVETVTTNCPPTANNQSVSTNQDAAVAITLTGSDPNSYPLTYTVVGMPAHGTLSGTAPNLTYTPSLGYSGQDSFTFKVNDGHADSNIATVSITVVPASPPTAEPQCVTTPKNTSVPITLTGTDTDGDPLTYSIVTGPTHGTLSGTAPNLTYTPAAGYTGPDSFTFTANDGNVDSTPAQVSITVTNAAPQCETKGTHGQGLCKWWHVPKHHFLLKVRNHGHGSVSVTVWVNGHRIRLGNLKNGPAKTYDLAAYMKDNGRDVVILSAVGSTNTSDISFSM